MPLKLVGGELNWPQNLREPSGFSGIVYAHGNEDILNFVAGNREKGKLSKDLKDAVMTQP